MVENFPDIIYFLNPEGYFSLAGGALERLLGFTPEDLTGKHFTSIVWPEDVEKACWHVNERRTGRRATKKLELRLATKHGEGEPFGIRYLTVELNACGMYDKRVSAKDKNFLGTCGVARDNAERRRLESQLQQAQKMEAIASLASGVAHDLNNILSGISGYTQLLVMDKKASDPEYDNLRQIQSLIQKAGDLTRNILAFTHQTASELRACDLNKDTKRGP